MERYAQHKASNQIQKSTALEIEKKGYASIRSCNGQRLWLLSDDYMQEWVDNQEQARQLLKFLKYGIEQQMASLMDAEEITGLSLTFQQALSLIQATPQRFVG